MDSFHTCMCVGVQLQLQPLLQESTSNAGLATCKFHVLLLSQYRCSNLPPLIKHGVKPSGQKTEHELMQRLTIL